MQQIDKKIQNYIKEHHLLTFAVCDKKSPYCANCFYAYLDKSLIFASDIDTKHIKMALLNPNVAGTISKETKNIGKIQGIQFVAKMKMDISFSEKEAYLKRFPFAKFHKPLLWTIKLKFIKFTDNTLGFGKKLIWED